MDWNLNLRQMDGFTKTTHTDVTPEIDPADGKFSTPLNVCVVGASEGIGEHIAYSYAKAGASVIVIVSRRMSELRKVVEKIRHINIECRVEPFECDITSWTNVETLAIRCRILFGHLNVVVSAPAYTGPVTTILTEGNPEWFQRNFDVNVIGLYNVVHFLVRLLDTSDGPQALIVVGSLASCIMSGDIANTGYCLSKMTQSRLVEYLAVQFPRLLSVCVHPGSVATTNAVANTPASFLPYLTDSIDLFGAFCTWLTENAKDLRWLSGRTVSATWDVE